MKCIVIEDQPPAQRILKKYIEDLGTLELLGVFSDATLALEFLREKKADLIFLDIHLPKLSGMDFLRIVPDHPSVILTTAFSDYALESYDYGVVDYLLKPFSFQRFVQAVSRVKKLRESADGEPKGKPDEIFIKSGYDHIRVTLSNIEYIKSDADYTEIFVDNRKLLSSNPLRFWEEFLDASRFLRIHKSFIVNLARIVKVSGNQVYLDSGEKLPIGRAYKNHFADRFLK